MTQLKRSKIKNFQPIALQSAMVLIGLVSLVGIAVSWVNLIPGLIVFCVTLFVSIIASGAWMKSLTCEDCGRALRAPKGWWYRFSGKPIHFHCDICDVNWDFGLRGHED
ncbi:hypothetical protein [Ruegeria sp. HKCCD8929]|uniref:hypothetical protein n=1 Tax=Ruegeria sp. HKCCD8929 TaxID=2683006 RepID=UPI00148888B1|nr:hypothetical protein [Ruegeria sp. HKCCD8929]